MVPFRLDRLRPIHTYLTTRSSEVTVSHVTSWPTRHASFSARPRLRQKPKSQAELLPALSAEERASRTRERRAINDQVNVKFFEQEEEGQPGYYEEGPQAKRRRVEDDQYLEELAGEEDNFNQGLEALEEDLERFKLPKDEKDDALQNVFSKEDRVAGTAALLRNLDNFGGFPHRVKLPDKCDEASRIFLEKLNQCLDEASLDPGNEKARKDLWRFYERSKIYIPGFLGMLPEAAWELLWTSQSEESEANTSRASHLRVLGEDMIKAGRSLDSEKRLGRLEGLFLDGKQEEALVEWEKAKEAGDAGNPDFLELGIRMHTYAGKLKRAEELVDVLFKLHSSSNPRIMAQLISASINTGTEEGAKRGWTVYNQMRDRLSKDMTMQDFDSVSMDFLRNDRKDYALAVFRDMMLLGEAREVETPSMLQRVSDRFASLLNSASDAKEATEISLQTMEYMPRKYQNRFFYAKWLKKLIGMGELDSAAQVIELMYERGVYPDAKHLNGLIGAWLRQESEANRQKAEELAWAMIQKRLDHVRQRQLVRSPKAQIPRISISDNEGVQIPLYKERRVPSATIETFCTLLVYYIQQSSIHHVRHLRNLLDQTEIQMNSVFMNQLLYHYFQTGGHREAYRRFVVLTRTDRSPGDPTRPVSPDIETWITLWECMKTELAEASNISAYTSHSEKQGFPTPRQLLTRMLTWFASLRGQAKTNALSDIENDTYNDIIRTFLMARDLPGAFVAMHALTSALDVWPSGKTARMLLLQISQHNTDRGRRHRRVLKPGNADLDDKMARTASILDLVTQHRRDALKTEVGQSFDALNERGQAEESLRTLMQFLYTLLRRQEGGEGRAAEQILRAATEMHMEEFDVEKRLALWKEA